MRKEVSTIKIYMKDEYSHMQRIQQEILIAVQNNPTKLNLWKVIIAFEGDTFITSGRGKDGTGSTQFTYEISRGAGKSGRHYNGESVDGFGNELWIILPDVQKKKSISRSTVDRAYSTAMEKMKTEGCVKGPKQLDVPGAHSYLFPMFIRFGIIRA